MPKLPLPYLGVDLVTDETQLPAGTARAIRNVDLDKLGTIKRRDGYTTVVQPDADLTGIHDHDGQILIGRGTEVHVFDTSAHTMQSIGDMEAMGRLDFCNYNGAVYIANDASQRLWVRPAGGQIRRAGVHAPSLPYVQDHPAGTLTPGNYGVAITALDASGEESRAYRLGIYSLTAGLQLTALPTAGVAAWRLYLTPPGGDVFYLAEQWDAGLTDHTATVQPNGAPCQTLDLQPMPGGQFVRAHAGRIYVASGSTLWYSEPLRPHLHAPRRNFVSFVGRIRFLEVMDGGAYVGDDRGVWFLAGSSPPAWTQRRVSEAVAAYGSSIQIPSTYMPGGQSEDPVPVWLSTLGYMVGSASGNVRALNADRVRLAPNLSGRTVFLSRDGMRQLVTLTAAFPGQPVYGSAIDSPTP